MSINAIDCVLSLGDKQITGKGCFIESVSTTISNDIEQACTLRSRGIIPMPRKSLCRIDIQLICSSIDIHDLLFSDLQKNSIRHKKVDDCSINELLFAVRSKLSKK